MKAPVIIFLAKFVLNIKITVHMFITVLPQDCIM